MYELCHMKMSVIPIWKAIPGNSTLISLLKTLFCGSSFEITFRACITCFSKTVLMWANVRHLIWFLGKSPKSSGAKSGEWVRYMSKLIQFRLRVKKWGVTMKERDFSEIVGKVPSGTAQPPFEQWQQSWNKCLSQWEYSLKWLHRTENNLSGLSYCVMVAHVEVVFKITNIFRNILEWDTLTHTLVSVGWIMIQTTMSGPIIS